jgi:hypothetical protein
MPCQFHPPWLDHSNYTWRRVQFVKNWFNDVYKLSFTTWYLKLLITLCHYMYFEFHFLYMTPELPFIKCFISYVYYNSESKFINFLNPIFLRSTEIWTSCIDWAQLSMLLPED